MESNKISEGIPNPVERVSNDRQSMTQKSQKQEAARQQGMCPVCYKSWPREILRYFQVLINK